MKDEFAERETSSMILPVLISGAVGAGLALLLTPKSGRDLRSDIGRMAKRGDKTSEPLEEGKVALNEAVSMGQESIAETREQISDVAGEYEAERSLVVPILVSGVVGAAVALLFAPKPGKDVVADLKDAASAALEKSKDWYEQSASAVKDAIEKGKEAAIETKDKLRPAA